MKTKLTTLFLFSLLLFATASCSKQKIEISAATIKPSFAGGVSAVYFTIKNNGDNDLVFTGGKTGISEAVEIHEMVHEGNLMKMQRIDSITVQPGKSAVLKPGGKHLMLINLKKDMKVGEKVQIDLLFQGEKALPLTAVVKAL